MNTKLKTILQQLLQSPRRFPIELALGIAFFVIAVWDSETNTWNNATKQMESAVNGDILWFFVPLMVLTFWLHRVNRWAYLASFLLFLPLMALDLNPFLWTYGFGFTYVLAAILLIVGNKRMDNRSFAAHALHIATQMFFGLLVTGILNLAVVAIVASFFYIFGIDEPKHFYEHIYQFIWFILPVELFQILKDDAVKVLHSICQQIWKTQQWPQDWKRSVFIPIPKKGNAKECSNYCTIALISHASKVLLKILQARLQQYVNHELPDVQAGFRKGRGTRDQIANIHWIIKKARKFQKNIYFCFIDYAKAFEYVNHNKLWKILQEIGNTRLPDLPPEKSVCRSRSNS